MPRTPPARGLLPTRAGRDVCCGGISGAIQGCACTSPAGSRACKDRGEMSPRVPSACPSMRSAVERREESREEGANPTGESSEPVPNRHQQNHVRQQHWSAAGGSAPSVPPRTPPPPTRPLVSPSLAAAAPAPEQSEVVARRTGGSTQSATTAQPPRPSAAAACPCHCEGTVPGVGGEPLCHWPGRIPAPLAQPQALGWIWVEITFFSRA